MQEHPIITEFDFVLQDIVNSREKYAKSPNTNPSSIQLQDNRIGRLVTIRNQVEGIGDIDLWSQINHSIKNLKHQDPSINEIIIRLTSQTEFKRQGHLTILTCI